MFRASHILVALASLLAVACAGTEDIDDPKCVGAKCDLPDDSPERSCDMRRADAFNDNQLAYTDTAMRWSCADVDGVSGADRGQEYCEYFAIVQLPAGVEQFLPPPQVLGRLVRHEPENPDDPDAYPTFTELPTELYLTGSDIRELEYDPTAVVGQCVFTSWNSDYDEIPEACDEPEGCTQVMGVPLEAEDFQMKFEVNSYDAAQVLVEDCFVTDAAGDPRDDSDPLHDDFYRGCMLNSDLNGTEYRKSDSTVCASAMRMAECGCGSTAEETLSEMISPEYLRGFPLGTWSGADELPPGCGYEWVGDLSQTVVTCDLLAEDVLSYASDLKDLCGERYGPNVVVHVPLPTDVIDCNPDQATSRYSDTCSAKPWVVEDTDRY